MALWRRAALSLFRPRPPLGAPDLDAVHNLLVVRAHDQLGDFLLITPALRALRLRFPRARITLVVNRFLAPLAEHQPDVDRVLVVGKLPMIPREPYDLALVLNTVSHSLTSDLIARLSGARCVIGPASPPLKDAPGAPLYDWTYLVPAPTGQHQMDRALASVAPLGCSDVPKEYRYGMTENENAAGAATRASLPRGPVVAMHLGTKDDTRRYPAKQWAAVADHVAEATGAHIAILDAPDARAANAELAATMRAPNTSLPPSGLRDAAATLRHMDLLLCHDSAPLHLAAAVGTRTVAVGGRDDARRWKPPGERHIALEAPDRVPAHVAPEDLANAAIAALR